MMVVVVVIMIVTEKIVPVTVNDSGCDGSNDSNSNDSANTSK
jgi:hypothetical protein